MGTVQPLWRFVASLEDVSPLDYGGAILYRDARGNYRPEIEVIEIDESYDDKYCENVVTSWRVYRFIVEPHTFVDGILSDNPYHPTYPVWYADKLAEVAASSGQSEDAMVAALTGADIIASARTLLDIAHYFGVENFNSYPLTFSRRSDMRRRYRSLRRHGLHV